MRALQLDFKRQRHPLAIWGTVLLALGVTALAFGTHATLDLSGRIAQAQARLQGLSAPGMTAAGGTGAAPASAEDLRQANEILRQLAMPWGELFRAVETTKDAAVAILALQPDAGRRVLRIDGEARNMEALLAYIGRLESNGAFKQVLLDSHEIRLDDPERPVRFGVSASWAPHP